MKVFLTILIFFSASIVLAAEPGPGQAICRMDENKNCHIAWSLTNEKNAHASIERFIPGANGWVVEYEDAGVSDTADLTHIAAPGNAYRVVECDDRGCMASTVVWAPVLAESSAEIPAVVRLGDGSRLNVAQRLGVRESIDALDSRDASKEELLEYQLLQYNIYLVRKTFENADMVNLPEMTEIAEPPPTFVELIQYNAQQIYEGLRHRAMGTEPEVIPEREPGRLIHLHGGA